MRARGDVRKGPPPQERPHPQNATEWAMRVPKGAPVGSVILVQCAENDTAAWPSDMPHWTPPPAVTEGVEPNAEWVAHRCP
eukprot:3176317-Lingulodinium_polyedra.AAC.1